MPVYHKAGSIIAKRCTAFRLWEHKDVILSLKDCIHTPQTDRILRHQYVTGAANINGAYLHKSIDKKRLNGHIPRPLNCPHMIIWELDLG